MVNIKAFNSVTAVNTEDYYIKNPSSIPYEIVEDILCYTLNLEDSDVLSILNPVTGCVELIEDFHETDLYYEVHLYDYDELIKYNDKDYYIVPTRQDFKISFATEVTNFLEACGYEDKHDYIVNGHRGIAERLRDCELYYKFQEYQDKCIASRYLSWKKDMTEKYLISITA